MFEVQIKRELVSMLNANPINFAKIIVPTLL